MIPIIMIATAVTYYDPLRYWSEMKITTAKDEYKNAIVLSSEFGFNYRYWLFGGASTLYRTKERGEARYIFEEEKKVYIKKAIKYYK